MESIEERLIDIFEEMQELQTEYHKLFALLIKGYKYMPDSFEDNVVPFERRH